MKFSSFFSNLQEAPWYRDFLNPVLDEVENNSSLLDIGTGSGKMLEILSDEKKVSCVGTDTSQDMLDEAKVKLKNNDIQLHLTPVGELLPFEKNNFDYITICSVFFHLKKDEIDSMLKEYTNLLSEKGKIIVLTPTGSGNIFKLTRHFFSLKNKTIYVWYRATKKRSRIWTDENYLANYSSKNNLKYKREIVMKGFAQLEIIEN